MTRVLIIGCSGTGKTTLAKEFGTRLELPVHHLDRLWWLPGWVHDSRENFDVKLAEIQKTDKWIIDGDYSRTLPERLKYADTVIFLDYSRTLCLYRALKRLFHFHGSVRSDMANGCPERFDWEFLRYVWNFNRDMRPRVETGLAGFPGEIVRLKTPRETDAFLKGMLSEF